jgi:hypothetical protein
MNHRTFFTDRQSSRYGTNNAKYLANESRGFNDSGKIYSVQVALHFWDSRSGTDRLDPDKDGGNRGKQQLHENESKEGPCNTTLL